MAKEQPFAAVAGRPIRVERMPLGRASRARSTIYLGDSATLLRAAARRLRGPGWSDRRFVTLRDCTGSASDGHLVRPTQTAS